MYEALGRDQASITHVVRLLRAGLVCVTMVLKRIYSVHMILVLSKTPSFYSAFRSVMQSKCVIKFYLRLPNMDKECHN